MDQQNRNTIGMGGGSAQSQPTDAASDFPLTQQDKPLGPLAADVSYPSTPASTTAPSKSENLKEIEDMYKPVKPTKKPVQQDKSSQSTDLKEDLNLSAQINDLIPQKQFQRKEEPAKALIDDVGPDLASTETIQGTLSVGTYPYTIEQLLDMVVQRDASDLHVSQGYPAMVRIDGELTPVSKDLITKEVAEKLIYPLLPEKKREILDVNREVDLAYTYGNIARFRINVYYERKNLAAALRLIPSKIRTIEELMLPKILHEIVKLPQGLVLVTGPTGCGKSTTLAAMIDEINKSRPVHILTIEDPIEYLHSPAKALIDQREMNEDTHSWQNALRSALRQDPDVVLVGEMRDFETIAAAITVAETGHLVFATLHTNDSAQTMDRIIDVFPEYQQAQIRMQLSNVIEAVVAQRLVPIIGGGRRAVMEVMLATPAIRNIVREAKTEQIDNAIRTGADVGMLSLEQSLVSLVREGKLTVDDAQKYTPKPEEILRLVKS